MPMVNHPKHQKEHKRGKEEHATRVEWLDYDRSIATIVKGKMYGLEMVAMTKRRFTDAEKTCSGLV